MPLARIAAALALIALPLHAQTRSDTEFPQWSVWQSFPDGRNLVRVVEFFSDVDQTEWGLVAAFWDEAAARSLACSYVTRGDPFGRLYEQSGGGSPNVVCAADCSCSYLGTRQSPPGGTATPDASTALTRPAADCAAGSWTTRDVAGPLSIRFTAASRFEGSYENGAGQITGSTAPGDGGAWVLKGRFSNSRYGTSGTFTWTFAPDCQSFRGQWSNDTGASGPWNGQR